MIKRIVIFLFVLFIALPAHALDLTGAASLTKGQNRIALGGSVLFGTISPPPTFSHSTGNNKALMFEERISYSHGFGDAFLKDIYLEIETIIFQSRQETVSGVLVHSRDTGFAATLRAGGNFIHTQDVTFGMWLQTSVPIVMDKRKFVNPVLDFVGIGLNTGVKISKVLGFSQAVYFGSGLFSPNRRNPHVQSTTLALINFGKPWYDKDAIIKVGAVIETDLTTRIDANYAASPIADGRINNLVFITPFLVEFDLGKGWSIEAGHAIKWTGKSIRGSQFSKFSVAKKF